MARRRNYNSRGRGRKRRGRNHSFGYFLWQMCDIMKMITKFANTR